MASSTSNTVFEDAGPPVVDGALLEAAKENIRPLASGRRATALAGILATPHAKRETLLADKHKRFRDDVAQAMANEAKQEADIAAGLLDQDELEAHDTDALGIYSSYVAWTVENYPEGHVSIIPLLEEATRALRDVRGKAYRQDPRYLKLWTRYSELVDKPEVIWRFMLANDIGTEWAAMYEAFALVLERSGKKQAADEIYTLGISRSAQPLMRLQAKYREFQKRMMLAPSLSTSSPTTTNPAAAPPVKRKILGDATKKSSHTPVPALAPSLIPTSQSTSRSNARLDVFVDDEAGGVDSGTDAHSWPELGTRTTRTKENLQEVKKMAGTTLKQKSSKSRATATSTASSSRVGSTFSVFTGPEEDDPPPPSVPISKSTQPTSASAPKRVLGSKSVSTVPRRTSSSGGNGSTFSVFTGSEDDPPTRTATTTTTTEANSEQSGGGFVPFCDDEDDNDTDLFAARSSKSTATEPTKSKTLGPTASLAKAPSLSNVDNHVVKEAEALRKDPLKNYN